MLAWLGIPVDLSAFPLLVSGTRRVTPAGNARTRDAFHGRFPERAAMRSRGLHRALGPRRRGDPSQDADDLAMMTAESAGIRLQG